MGARVVPALGIVAVLAYQAAQAETRDWNATLERIASGVVSIRVDATRAFDTDWNGSSQATGFVVDAERGLILTNRHVVTPGPVIAEAIFRNNEEVALTPVYRDPVHDFGLYRYDPAELDYIEPTELKLHPSAAATGREIRVIGNDAGEQLSILAGTLARLDREAPFYGRGKYNDFNTFYYQAASGTSGGSSGSPVIDIDGRVVALNAGGRSEAASSFYLPLNRVKRALELIQAGEAVPRGTLKTIFAVEPYDELNRLGLREATEADVRASFPQRTGMLVVQQVIPGAAADGPLEPGDILVRVDGDLIADFDALAARLDNAVGAEVTVEIERGGVAMTQRLPVSDLHAITPDNYIQFGDAIVHNLSYQQARHYNRPLSGVFVANPGYVLSNSAIPRGAVVTEMDGQPVADLDDFEAVLETLPEDHKTTVRFVTLDAPQTDNLRIVRIEREWFPNRRCARNDDTGIWPCRALAEAPAGEPVAPRTTRFVAADNPVAQTLAPSLVLVNFDLPYTVSGVADRHYYGTGVIVDTERGFVVVDRNTVPIALGDVTITIAGSIEIPGRVEYVHPLHNLAIVAYDPALIGETPVRAARFATDPVAPGDDVVVVGLRGDHRLQQQRTSVASIEPLILPLTRTLRFRDRNLETIALVNAPDGIDGVVADSRGNVLAIWSSFAVQSGSAVEQLNRGVPAELVEEFVATALAGQPVYSLEAEFGYAPLAAARKLGLPDEWAERLEAHNPKRRQALSVTRLVGGSPADALLRAGDLVLAVDGQVVTTFRELERAVNDESVILTLLRDGEEIDMTVETVALNGRGVDRVVSWAGALIQEPHRPVAAQRGIAPRGAYVAFYNFGSPAQRYGLWGGRRIIEVDGKPTPDLDSFIDAIRRHDHRESVRLKTLDFNEAVDVITLKVDNLYWPGYEVRRVGDTWVRQELGVDG